jgi:predicted outer membrane protein
MSVMERMSIGVLMASFCCVLSGIAAAQQAAPATGRDQSEARESVSDQQNPGAENRASQQQRERSTSEGVRGREQSNRPNSRSQAVVGGQNREVEQFLAGCLLAKNVAELELSQFAEKQSQSPEVKKFAQMMIQDHQKMIQQLEQLAGTQGYAIRQADRSNDAFSTDADNQRVGRDTSDRTAVDSSRARTNQSSPGSNAAIQQLAQIERQIVERQTQATRDELQQKSGVEFDKCFLGTAIVAHVHMIAALQVIEQQGQGQLAQAAKQARPVAEQHLDHAKQLMKQLESGAPKVGQAERRPAGTQR